MYCSPVMRFCVRPGDEQEPAIRPSWSMLVYMLLVEARDIDDDHLKQIFGIVVPMGEPSSSGSGSTGQGSLNLSGALKGSCTYQKTGKEKDSTQREFDAGPKGAIRDK